ncbi:MAG: RNA 2',3'-cyclic phosphodiesterase [Nanoarchaeota archaeon]|nr:RNA 2',3'-cyclic phosphodiesterase [Nanoarchaeota archaeon]
MRLFLAIDIPEKLKEKISKIQIKDFIGKKVEKENIHINLKFLGEMPSPNRLIKELETIKYKPFTIRINGFDAFPNKKFAKILHLKIESPELIELQKTIQQTMRNFDARHYTPHITLMRVKEQERPTMIYEQEFKEEIIVKEYALFKSNLTHHGPEYENIHMFKSVN